MTLVDVPFKASDEEVTDLALTCCIISLTWARSCLDTRWIEMTWNLSILICDSKHWSDIVFGSSVVLSVLTFATVRSNVNLENWLLAKSFGYSFCDVKGGRRIYSLRWIPDDASSGYRLRWFLYSLHVNCYHAFVYYRWISTFFSSARCGPHVIVLTSDSSQGLDDPIRRIRSNYWRWWRKNIWNYLLTGQVTLIIIMSHPSSSTFVSSYGTLLFLIGSQ